MIDRLSLRNIHSFSLNQFIALCQPLQQLLLLVDQ